MVSIKLEDSLRRLDQRHIQNPVEHLRWNFLQKCSFRKKSHLRHSIWQGSECASVEILVDNIQNIQYIDKIYSPLLLRPKSLVLYVHFHTLWYIVSAGLGYIKNIQKFIDIISTSKTGMGIINVSGNTQSSIGVLEKRSSGNMEQIYRITPMPKCDFNNVAKQLYSNHTSALVFSCRFSPYFQNTFSSEYPWRAASEYSSLCTNITHLDYWKSFLLSAR